MKKITFWKSFFLLCALIVGSTNVWADDYERVTSTNDLVAGEKYIIVNENGGKAVGLLNNSSKLAGISVTISSNKTTLSESTNVNIITLGGTTDAYTLCGNDSKYIGWKSSTDFQTATSASTNYYRWKITFSNNNVVIKNVQDDSRLIRYYSSGSDFRAYTSSSGSTVQLYKKKTVAATALEVKTAPTKINYKVGEKLDLTGLVLDATVGGNHIDVTSGYTATIGGTAVTSGTTALNTVGAQTITFTYGGKTCNQVIHVGVLQNIALTTTSVKTEYNAGQTFDPTNLVVTANFSDEETTATEWEETVAAADYTITPSGALATTDTKVTIGYTWAEVDKTADIDITVNAATAYTVTFNAGTGSCATASLTEATGLAGVTLPTATIGVTGWTFAGWAEALTTNTEVAPTLYAAATTYHPVDNVTLYAVYKYVDGTEGEYKRATTVAEVKAAKSIIVVNSKNSKTLTYDLSNMDALSETDYKVTSTAKAVFTLSGDDSNGYTLTGNGNTIGAATLPTSNSSSTDIALTTSNNKWSIVACTNSSYTNQFVFINKNGTNVGLEYSSKWLAYKTNSSPASSQYHASKVYIPNFTIVYNSNPAAIINPSVAFTTAGNKTLYLKNTNTYNNAANVTGIAKTAVYTSSDATVASVSDAGVVTALKAGTTTITAKVEKEVGVNTEASASYVVTVKTASDVAGIKAITDLSTTSNFTADLTDAVVTYVKGNRAYIQDASGAIYVNFSEHGLTAGKKINGAVSGSVKAPNQIDEISALNLDNATVTNDGVIPDALVVTLATIVANKTDYEGKRVQVANATVTAKLELGQNSNGKISDDNKTTEMNLYAPDGDIEALKDAVGTFTGIISLYGGDTPRFNIYDQEWVSLTRNAPTAQALTFDEDAVVLDEATDEYNAFTGQAVEGAQGTVTYSKTADESNIIESLNTETGAIVLSGACGTATIKATAAAIEVTEGGITTPYTATNKSYTITVRPRWTVTFNILGTEVARREAGFEAGVTAPEVETFGNNVFQGWTDAAIDTPTNEAPTTIITDSDFDGLTGNVTYYALFGKKTTSEEDVVSTLNLKQSEPANPSTINGVTWSWSSVTFSSSGNTGMEKSKNATVTFTLPDTYIKVKKIELECPSNMAWGGDAVVVLKADETTLTSMVKDGSYTFTTDNNKEGTYTMSQTTSANAWINDFKLTYVNTAIAYNQYTTNPKDKTNIIMEDADGNKVAESIDLSAMTDATALAGVHADAITYTRTMGKLSTLYLPYASTIPDGMTAYEFNGINDAGTALNFNVVEGTTLDAYTPYVLEQEASASKTLSATNVDIVADTNGEIVKDEWTLMGTIARIENADLLAAAGTGTPYVVQSDKKWHPVQTNAAVYIPAFRAYFIASEASGARIMEMNLGGETTSIDKLDVIDDLDDNTPIFNLAGQKVTKAYKGVVIQNGKKVVRK